MTGRPAWMDQAMCRGVHPNVFHPEPVNNRRHPTWAQMEAIYATATGYCQRCPVIEECLRYAIDHDLREGMWGGLRPGQRQTLRRKQQAA